MQARLHNLKLLVRRRLPAVLVLGLLFCTLLAGLLSPNRQALAAANGQINFQARLMNSTGSIAPDGFYNVVFKIYDASTSSGSSDTSCSGDAHCLWTEQYYDSNGVTAGNDARVRVANGYVTVSLGSQTAFPSTIKWGDQLWVTMNIGGTTQTATPTYDGEMSPRLQLTAVPYAFATSTLSGGTGANITTLDAGTPSGSNLLHLPAESGTLCVQNSVNCGFVTGTTASFIQNGTSVQTNANFNIRSAGTGSVGGVIQGANGQTADLLDLQSWNGTSATTVFGVNNVGALTLGGAGTTNFVTPASSSVPTKINIPTYDPGSFGQILAFGLPSGANATSRAISIFDDRPSGHQQTLAIFSPDENGIVGFNWDGSNTAAIVGTNDKTATGGSTNTIIVRSGNVAGGNGTSGDVQINTGTIAGGSGGFSTGSIYVVTGDAAGTNANSGGITVDTGTKTGSGTSGAISIGVTNASAVTLGHSGMTTTSNGNLTLAANQNLTLQNGSGVFSQTYSTSTAGSAQVLSATNTNAGGSSIAVNGQDITLVGTATSGGTNTNTALKFEDPTAQTNNVFYGMNFTGTGYTDVLRVNGSQIISGAGKLQNAGLDSSISYTNLTKVGTLTSGALGAGFTTVAVGQGGTGTTTFTANGVLYGNGTSPIAATAAGTTGQCLVGNTGLAPSWSSCISSVSLQTAYAGGNTISTSSNDIGFTLNGSDKFTVATAAGGTGSTVFSLADGSNATPPAQLVLITNSDTNEPVAAGLKITSAAGGITNAIDLSGANITNAISLGSNKILGTTAVIDFSNFDVSGAGAVTAVGVDSGTGLVQGTGGLTIGGTTSINNSVNSNTSINTGTSTGTVTIGNGAAGAISVQSGSTIALAGTNVNLSTGGVLNVIGGSAGFQIGGAAATGNYLRGNGTSFVSSAIQSGDIPVCTGSCNYISNQTTQQSSANFNISGTGIAGVALQAPLIQTADGTGASTAITLRSGNSTTSGNTGDVTIASGAATSGNSGNVSVDAGTASGTKGTVSVGNTNATSINIGGGSGATTTVAGGNVAHTVNIAAAGTSTVQAVTVGSTGSTSTLVLQGGTGTATGDINIGDQTTAGKIIDIGSVDNAGTGTVRIATGAAAQTVTIGSTNSSSTTTIQGGTGNINLTVAAGSVANATKIVGSGGTFQMTGPGGISSGATTMTASSAASTFTTSVSLTLNAGDYIIPTTTTGQARVVTATATGTTFSVNPVFTGAVSAETFTIHRPIANFLTNGGATGLAVQGSTGNVGAGTVAPTRQLDVAVNNSTVNALPLIVEQAGTGDVGIEFKTPSKNFFTGVDASDGIFKIASSASANGTFNVGTQSIGAGNDSNANGVQAAPIVPGTTGTISSISVYMKSVAASPNNHIQVGVYSNSGGNPGTLLASSSTAVATVGWNTLSVGGATLVSGTTYWIAMAEDGSSGFATNTGGGPANSTNYDTTSGYTLPGTAGNPGAYGSTSNSADVMSIYATLATVGTADNFGGIPFFRLSDTGQMAFQNAIDSTSAFRVQNAAGTNLIGLDTSNATLNLGASGTDALASTVNVGTSTGATQTVNLGSTGSANAAAGTLVNIQGGTTANTAVKIGTNGAGGITMDTGTTGSILIGAGTSNNAKTITIGPTATKTSATTIQIGVNTAGTETISLGSTGSANAAAGTTVNIQGGTTANTAVTIGTNGAGGITIDSGTTGNVNIGTGANSKAVAVGSTSGSSGLTLQSGTNNIVFNTAGTVRGTFDSAANTLYLGNGLTAGTPNNFSIQGTGSTTTAVAGGSLTVQGGNATVGNANGGNVTITGGTGFGTGVLGLVKLAPTTFVSSGSTQTFNGSSGCPSCSVTGVDSFSTIAVNATVTGLSISIPVPNASNQVIGRLLYLTGVSGSSDFTIVLGGTSIQIGMKANSTATLIWNGAGWTAAGASSSTDLQSAYNNTLTSAGGAELVVANSANANGLTIRDSLTSPISGTGNGTLLEVQTGQAASLFSVNSSVTDYANNGGAESAFGTDWALIPSSGATVTRNTNATYIATGTGSVSIATNTSAGSGAGNKLTAALTANLRYNVSFATKLTSGSAAFTDIDVEFSKDGTTTAMTTCTNYSTQTAATSVWSKVNCTFTAPASGITTSNAIFIRQTASGTSRTFYVDNLSVTISADLTYATDGGVDDNTNFTTNWTAVAGTGATVTAIRSTTNGNDTSDSAEAHITVGGSGGNNGIRNKLAISPLASTLYRISVYASSSTAMTDFTIRYSRDGGTNFDSCVDYNTQSLSGTITSFTQVTCYVTTSGTAPTNPYVYFTESGTGVRDIYVDTFTMTIASNAVPNIQVGGGVNGGPTTLFTLDRSASAPIAANNDALLGSMYYDTSLGKLQCYEADGWGACGSSPDVIVTLSPEFTNAVLHGPSGGTVGVGTMTSDICSDALNINDGSSSQPTICGTNETFNFYKWTSPQPTSQTYGIYVTYQLPTTFKSFASGSTSLMGRTDNGSSGGTATVVYKVYRNNSASGLSQCGSTVSVSTGTVSSWQIGQASGAADPSTCSFGPGDSIVFEIDMTASKDANAYVGNLGFTFSNK
ncbi:MAG TPA: hypothetical protein VL737_04705 [Candidatus Pristimantibacillus sp.]|nr:hypothetical protein [Candidatus Pristimantibacillus sp.]